MTRIENLTSNWIKYLEQLITESEQIRKEADDVGPEAEISYWKMRMIKFNMYVYLILQLIFLSKDIAKDQIFRLSEDNQAAH